jgi:hypothetical protein
MSDLAHPWLCHMLNFNVVISDIVMFSYPSNESGFESPDGE